jgi:hypothetical protein
MTFSKSCDCGIVVPTEYRIVLAAITHHDRDPALVSILKDRLNVTLVLFHLCPRIEQNEAITLPIAFAAEHACTALIDERKAIRICADRFPGLCIGSTVDILLHSEVRERLDQETLAVAAFNALQNGRMRVLPHHQGRIVQLIGPERAAQCQSLPRSVRFSPKSPIPNLF